MKTASSDYLQVSSSPICVWKADRMLGEGGWWSIDEEALYWVDIKDPAILRFKPSTGERAIWPCPEMIGCCAPIADGGFVAGFASGLYRITLGAPGSPPARTFLYRPAGHDAGDRFNDGKAHPDGSFWAGSMDDAERNVRGYYYRLAPSGEVSVVAGPYQVCNGPAFSPDGRYAYLSDSVQRTVYRIDLAANSPVIQPFICFEESAGYPDGCTTDALGRLWIAFWDGARVACFDPRSGIELAQIEIPTQRPTTCSFGGPGLGTLFITTARAPRSSVCPDPGGDLYAVSIEGVSGWPTPAYRSTGRT